MQLIILRLTYFVMAAILLGGFYQIVLHPAWQEPGAFFEKRRSCEFSVQELSVENRNGLVLRSLKIQGKGSRWKPDRAVEFSAYCCAPDSFSGSLPAFVLMGGLITGRDAVEEILSRPEISRRGIFLSLDYPWTGPERFKGLEILPWLPRIRQALFDGVEALRLAVDYLEKQPEVDPRRIVLLGVSLGAFYAVDAGAVDPRPAAVLAFMGGGELGSLLTANMHRTNCVPGLLAEPLGRFSALLLAPLEPLKLAGKISPRPYLQISAKNDDMVPVENARALYEAACEPRSLDWISTRHVRPGMKEVIEQFIVIADTKLKQYGLL